jgi:RNA polymerase sigma-70 factor (ECF subfamily)
VTRRGATTSDLEDLYRRRFEHFVRVAAAICNGGEAGRDAVQAAFVSAVRTRRSFRGDGPLEGWVWRIVVNEARRLARASTALPFADTSAEHSANGQPDDPLGVRALVAALPPRQREVLFLRYYADLEYRAIAEALEIEPGTVAATLNAAHQALRTRLEEVRR